MEIKSTTFGEKFKSLVAHSETMDEAFKDSEPMSEDLAEVEVLERLVSISIGEPQYMLLYRGTSVHAADGELDEVREIVLMWADGSYSQLMCDRINLETIRDVMKLREKYANLK